MIEKKRLRDFFVCGKNVWFKKKKKGYKIFCGTITFFRGCVIFVVVEMLFNVKKKIEKFCDEKNVKIICDKKERKKLRKMKLWQKIFCDQNKFV